MSGEGADWIFNKVSLRYRFDLSMLNHAATVRSHFYPAIQIILMNTNTKRKNWHIMILYFSSKFINSLPNNHKSKVYVTLFLLITPFQKFNAQKSHAIALKVLGRVDLINTGNIPREQTHSKVENGPSKG